MRIDRTHVDHSHTPAPGLWSALSGMVAGLQRDLFGGYRPERHYMRGPGPACMAKRARATDRKAIDVSAVAVGATSF